MNFIRPELRVPGLGFPSVAYFVNRPGGKVHRVRSGQSMTIRVGSVELSRSELSATIRGRQKDEMLSFAEVAFVREGRVVREASRSGLQLELSPSGTD